MQHSQPKNDTLYSHQDIPLLPSLWHATKSTRVRTKHEPEEEELFKIEKMQWLINQLLETGFSHKLI
jgi:hypothetical protein